MTPQPTPLMELIEWYDSVPKEVAQKLFFAKATSLLPKEREAIENAFVAGSERGTKDIPFNCEQYFTQTYKTP